MKVIGNVICVVKFLKQKDGCRGIRQKYMEFIFREVWILICSHLDPERAVSPPMLNHEEGLKALALAAGVDRIAQFHCDAPVSKFINFVSKFSEALMGL